MRRFTVEDSKDHAFSQRRRETPDEAVPTCSVTTCSEQSHRESNGKSIVSTFRSHQRSTGPKSKKKVLLKAPEF